LYKYKFSVIIPIYNVENYLKEAIESILNQTIGFKENIQLILINDGSTDNSEVICMEYKQKYPENITYLKKENGGVSSARNAGMQYIEGEYVNFLDGDDKWNSDVFELVWDFFKNNDVKLIACRKKYFEAVNDYHVLDYVFEEDRIINIEEDYQYVHLHSASTFFESNTAKKYKFDVNLKYGEDAKYVSEILLDEKKFGVLRKAEYNYRKRINETSILQKSFSDIRWYNETIEGYHKKIIEKSIKNEGKILPYIQYILMYDLKGRISKEFPSFMEEEQKKQYRESLLELIKKFDDYIICEQKKFYATDKIFVLSLKYGKDIVNDLEFIDGKFYFNNISILSIKNNNSICTLKKLKIKNKLILEGDFKIPIPSDLYDFYLENNSKKYEIELLEEESEDNIENKIFNIGRKKKFKYKFKTKAKPEKNNAFKFIMKLKNATEVMLNVNTEVIETSYNKKKYKLNFKDKEIFIEKKNSKIYRFFRRIF